ncbi:MAG TPA: hypothetical protein VH482_14535 [Thermomicrobiales bacterium]|jgi:hypothetical protein
MRSLLTATLLLFLLAVPAAAARSPASTVGRAGAPVATGGGTYTHPGGAYTLTWDETWQQLQFPGDDVALSNGTSQVEFLAVPASGDAWSCEMQVSGDFLYAHQDAQLIDDGITDGSASDRYAISSPQSGPWYVVITCHGISQQWNLVTWWAVPQPAFDVERPKVDALLTRVQPPVRQIAIPTPTPPPIASPYIDPTYGYTVTWNESWTASREEGFDLILSGNANTVRFRGVPSAGADRQNSLQSCVAQGSDWAKAQWSGEHLDSAGADGPDAYEERYYVPPYQPPIDPIVGWIPGLAAKNIEVRCTSLTPSLNLLTVWIVESDFYDTERPAYEALLQGIRPPR